MHPRVYLLYYFQKKPRIVILLSKVIFDIFEISKTSSVKTGSLAKLLIPEAKKRYTTNGKTKRMVNTIYFFIKKFLDF